MKEIKMDDLRFRTLLNGGSIRLDCVNNGSNRNSNPPYIRGENVIVRNGENGIEAMILDHHYSSTDYTHTYMIGRRMDG